MSSDAVWGTAVGVLIVVIIGLSVGIYHYRGESQRYQAQAAKQEASEHNVQEEHVSNTLDDVELGRIDGNTTTVAEEAADKKEEISNGHELSKRKSNSNVENGNSNDDSSDESENTFVVHSSQRSIQSPLAIYNDLKRRFSVSYAGLTSGITGGGAAGSTSGQGTYSPVASNDHDKQNDKVKNKGGNGKGKDKGKGQGKGLKENLLLSSKDGENGNENGHENDIEKENKAYSNTNANSSNGGNGGGEPSACRITRYHARLPSKIFLENKLKRLSITTANEATLNSDEDVVDVYSVNSSKEEKEKEKQNEKFEKQKIDNKKQNESKHKQKKPFPKITIVTNVASLAKPETETEKGKGKRTTPVPDTPITATPQTTIINPTPLSPVIIVTPDFATTPGGTRTRNSVDDEELNEANIVNRGSIVYKVGKHGDHGDRRRSSANSFSLSSGYSSSSSPILSPDLAETLNELPSNIPPAGNNELIHTILTSKGDDIDNGKHKVETNTKKGKDKNKELKSERRANNQAGEISNKQAIKTTKAGTQVRARGKVGKSAKPKGLTNIQTQVQAREEGEGERQGRQVRKTSNSRIGIRSPLGSPLRRQRERRVGLPKRVKSPLVGSSQRNSRNNSRNNSRRGSRNNSITIPNPYGYSSPIGIDSDYDWDRTKLPRMAAQPILLQSPMKNSSSNNNTNTNNNNNNGKTKKGTKFISSKTPIVQISKNGKRDKSDTSDKTDRKERMSRLGGIPRATRSVTPKKCKCHKDGIHDDNVNTKQKNKNRSVSRHGRKNTVTGGRVNGKTSRNGRLSIIGKNGKSSANSKGHRQSVSLSPNRAPRKSKGKKENLMDFKKQQKKNQIWCKYE